MDIVHKTRKILNQLIVYLMQSIVISHGNYVEDPNHNCIKNLNIIGCGINVLFTLNSLYINGSNCLKILRLK